MTFELYWTLPSLSLALSLEAWETKVLFARRGRNVADMQRARNANAEHAFQLHSVWEEHDVFAENAAEFGGQVAMDTIRANRRLTVGDGRTAILAGVNAGGDNVHRCMVLGMITGAQDPRVSRHPLPLVVLFCLCLLCIVGLVRVWTSARA